MTCFISPLKRMRTRRESRADKGTVFVAFLLSLLFLSLAVFVSQGGIHPAYAAGDVYVTVNSGSQVMVNSMSLGFDLDHEWNTWLNNPTLTGLTQNASFKFVRFFDWKSSSPKSCTYWNEAAKSGTFNWANVDSLVRKIIATGAEPIITLGCYSDGKSYVPPGMAINPVTRLPYPDSFARYAAAWATHFKSVGLPVRFYEIWNEPRFYFPGSPYYWIFNPTRLSYFFTLFNATYVRMHQADSQVLIGNDATLYRVFLDYWIQHKGKLDFIAIHKYDSYGPCETETMAFKRAEELFFVTDGIWYSVNQARSMLQQVMGRILPAIITEGNFAAVCTSGTDPRIQKMTGAVWLALQLRASILNRLDGSLYYSCADSAMYSLRNSFTGGLGFGMINTDNNQPWYPYYVQKLIGNNLRKGDTIVSSTSSSGDVRSLAWVDGKTLNILIICKINQYRTLHVSGLSGQLSVTKIDNTYSYLSPRLQKTTMGSTQTLSLNGYTVALLQTTV
jgi:hypothetical protein